MRGRRRIATGSRVREVKKRITEERRGERGREEEDEKEEKRRERGRGWRERRKEGSPLTNNHSRSITTSDSSVVEDETADAVRVTREKSR